jgi:hypothetical protein
LTTLEIFFFNPNHDHENLSETLSFEITSLISLFSSHPIMRGTIWMLNEGEKRALLGIYIMEVIKQKKSFKARN